MSADRLEAFLARLYTDRLFREEFERARRSVALREGLAAEDLEAVLAIDADDLALAAESYAAKRRSARSAG